ncbi:uncharacterized protein LOC135371738 [Ornithodoros turicata]|uniref:uncharacterized protein LOC135371738 n=1 Tax=Ornithodoros turicata TaxID=34597 RepID=UPI00313A3232
MTAWAMRFVYNCSEAPRLTGQLTAEEMSAAATYWIRTIQASSFAHDQERLRKGMSLKRSSLLYQYPPYLDENGIMRLTGRLQKSRSAYEEKHPAILPSDSYYTVLIVWQAHRTVLHAGTHDTLMEVRNKFWISRGRQLVKRVLRTCTVCKRFEGRHGCEVTPPLPQDRITEASPFSNIGIDFAGPLLVKGPENPMKSYIAVFTCATTRAVHLELVTSMKTDSFLRCFRRFASRRGLCNTVYSDNAPTFKRSNRELKKLWHVIKGQEVEDYLACSGISWKFIPVAAPWWGGFYERMIRSIKQAIRKTIGRRFLEFDEVATILTEVEAVINSGPLTYTYSEFNEPTPLSPALFLTGRRLTDLSDVWKTRQEMLRELWLASRKEYLGELRSAHLTSSRRGKEFEVGEIVLVGSKKPRLLWKMGQVEAINRGNDGGVRSCTVRTTKGLIKGIATRNLYHLEAPSKVDSCVVHWWPGNVEHF